MIEYCPIIVELEKQDDFSNSLPMQESPHRS